MGIEGEKLDQDGLQWEMGADGKNTLPFPSSGALPDFPCDLEHAQDIAPSLEAQSVTVFSSEWRESAPRGSLEQKARYLPAALSSLFYPTTPEKPTVPRPAGRTSLKPVSVCFPLCSSLLVAI